MKLRFKVNQGEAFRRGVDAPKSIAHVEVDPAKLDQTMRDLISERMLGISVYAIAMKPESEVSLRDNPDKPELLEANGSTLDDLIEAVRKDATRVAQQ